MHHPPLASADWTARFLAGVGGLAEPERRQEHAATLARLLGGERLVLLARDPELEVLLPAPGLSQVLHGAAAWRAFAEACVREAERAGSVPDPGGGEAPAHGCAAPDGTTAVLVRPAPGAAGPGPLRPLLPLLGALFREERRILANEARARSAADDVERAQLLNRALHDLRRRLEDALAEARQARAEAADRAREAEDLAAELQAQAEMLQEQAVELEMLNDELTARTEEAETARTAADEANRAKSEFLANMSHELRTPINAVIGYTELLDLGITGPITGEQQAQLARIRASSAHLLGLINDVLDLAKVEAGHLSVEHERESVARVVAEALALVEGTAAARDIAITNLCSDTGATYVGDRDRARQILVNLLSNAVKFTEPGGRIRVHGPAAGRAEPPAEPPAGEGPWTCIAVEDSGIGMTAEQLARVFQPFVQAESGRTRTRGGTGLGLTISRKLARLMGGELTARSTPGEGSCFFLWLPDARAERPAPDSGLGDRPDEDTPPRGTPGG